MSNAEGHPKFLSNYEGKIPKDNPHHQEAVDYINKLARTPHPSGLNTNKLEARRLYERHIAGKPGAFTTAKKAISVLTSLKKAVLSAGTVPGGRNLASSKVTPLNTMKSPSAPGAKIKGVGSASKKDPKKVAESITDADSKKMALDSVKSGANQLKIPEPKDNKIKEIKNSVGGKLMQSERINFDKNGQWSLTKSIEEPKALYKSKDLDALTEILEKAKKKLTPEQLFEALKDAGLDSAAANKVAKEIQKGSKEERKRKRLMDQGFRGEDLKRMMGETPTKKSPKKEIDVDAAMRAQDKVKNEKKQAKIKLYEDEFDKAKKEGVSDKVARERAEKVSGHKQKVVVRRKGQKDFESVETAQQKRKEDAAAAEIKAMDKETKKKAQEEAYQVAAQKAAEKRKADAPKKYKEMVDRVNARRLAEALQDPNKYTPVKDDQGRVFDPAVLEQAIATEDNDPRPAVAQKKRGQQFIDQFNRRKEAPDKKLIGKENRGEFNANEAVAQAAKPKETTTTQAPKKNQAAIDNLTAKMKANIARRQGKKKG